MGVFRARRVVSTFLCCLFLFGFFAFPATADDSKKVRISDPVNMDEVIGKNLDAYIAFQSLGDKAVAPVTGRGFFIDSVLQGEWMITRTVLHGLSGFEAAISRLQSDDVKKAIVFPWAKTLADDLFAETGYFGGHYEPPKSPSEVDLSRPEIANAQVLANHNRLIEILKDLGKRGFFGGGGSIFHMSQLVAFIFLVVFVMANVAFMAFKMLSEGAVYSPTEWFRVVLRFALSLLMIAYASRFVEAGITMSELVKRVISEAAFEGGNPAAAVSSLLDTKMNIMTVTGGGESFWSVLKSGASAVLSFVLSWISYFIAGAVIAILLIVSDVMMGLAVFFAPFAVALAFIPGRGDILPEWFRNFFSLLFYGPLAAVYSVLLVAMVAIGLDTSPIAMITVAIAFIIGAAKIPDTAKELSSGVLVAVAGAIAMAPAKFSGVAVGGAAKMAMGRMGR